MKITAKLAASLLSTVAVQLGQAWAAQPALPADQNTMLDATVQDAKATAVLHDGEFMGRIYDAYYGVVQVKAVVQGGSIVDVQALKFPNHSGTSRSINRQALPYLLQEVVAKQTSRVNIISGATLTSRAYIASLHDALVLSAK